MMTTTAMKRNHSRHQTHQRCSRGGRHCHYGPALPPLQPLHPRGAPMGISLPLPFTLSLSLCFSLPVSSSTSLLRTCLSIYLSLHLLHLSLAILSTSPCLHLSLSISRCLLIYLLRYQPPPRTPHMWALQRGKAPPFRASPSTTPTTPPSWSAPGEGEE